LSLVGLGNRPGSCKASKAGCCLPRSRWYGPRPAAVTRSTFAETACSVMAPPGSSPRSPARKCCLLVQLRPVFHILPIDHAIHLPTDRRAQGPRDAEPIHRAQFPAILSSPPRTGSQSLQILPQAGLAMFHSRACPSPGRVTTDLKAVASCPCRGWTQPVQLSGKREVQG